MPYDRSGEWYDYEQPESPYTGQGSPAELAQQGGYTDQLTNYTTALYGGGVEQSNKNATAATAAGVNLGNPDTWRNYTPAGYTNSGWDGKSSSNSGGNSGGGSSGGGGGGGGNVDGDGRPIGGAAGYPTGYQYNDPYTQQYERLGGTQLSLYAQQQQAMLRQALESETRRRADQTAGMERMTGYVNQRVNQLQQPAYTGAESEVMRTQLLDPLERDRTAAQQRALERVSARGFDPSSGIAHDLFQQVDRAFDEQRTRAQGGLAQAQIQEQRGRSQEAQSLLQYLAMLPDAVARGDLDFVSYVQSLIAQPGVQSLAVGGSLAEIGSDRLNEALATLGLGPSISGAASGAVNLLNQAQYQRQLQSQQQANLWGNIGQSFQF